MSDRCSRATAPAVIGLSLVLMTGVLLSSGAIGQSKPGQKRAIPAGEKADIKGVILSRDGETFSLRDVSATDTVVLLTDSTKIRTDRKGLFRGHKPFDMTVLMPGLILKAEGKGDSTGRLVAEDITFSESDLKAVITAYGQTAPVTKELSETDQQLNETSKDVIATNTRISELDQFEVVKTVAVLFAVNSATLDADAKSQLDELASKAPGGKNYAVEVKGFTDPSGDFEANLELSQRRADAVVQYLTVKHNIPLRRIMVPMGYGETKPVGGGKTEEDRKQSRRVEVIVLVNKGLNQ